MKERTAREAEIIAAVGELTTLPDVYLRVKRVVDDPRASIPQMSEAIIGDPATTARLLRLVNSAAFGLGVQVTTVTRAVTILGFQRVHDLVLTSTLTDITGRFRKADLEGYWRHSVLAGVAARELAKACSILDSERLMVAGLLSDLGHLLLSQVAPVAAQHARAVSLDRHIPLYRAEQEIIGADFAGIGAALMESWNLPDTLCVAVRYHVEPRRAVRHHLEAALLHIAGVVARYEGGPEGLNDPAGLGIDPAVWDTTGLTLEVLPEIYHQAQAKLREALATIYPTARAA